MVNVVIDKVLDLKGFICPRPMIMTMSVLKSMEKGQVLQIICNDSTTKYSIPSLCERWDFRLLEMKEEDGVISFIIQK